MRRNVLILFSISLFLSALFAPIDAGAQAYRRYKRESVDASIRRAEQTSDEFVRVFDRNLDNSVLNNSEREDKLNEKARDLESRLNSLRRDFDARGESWWDSRVTAADALQYAKGINNSVRARRYTPQCERMWVRLRSNLNDLARYYALSPLPR